MEFFKSSDIKPFSAKYKLFGKEAEVVIFDVDPVAAEAMADAAYREALRLHKIFNYYDEKSELSILNRKRALKVSKELLYVLEEALKICRQTEGEYDISLGKSIDLRKKGRGGPSASSYGDVAVNGDIVTLGGDAKIDLGSIAKGYIADRMVALLKEEGVISGYVDARGDIRIFGKHALDVGIQHPRENRLIETIQLRDCGVATSGDYSQYYGTKNNSHILNSKDLISVTVVGPDLMSADAIATAVFVSSFEKRANFLKKHRFHRVLGISSSLEMHYYNDFESLL